MDFLKDFFGLEGKTALVTGGATGVGKMIASALVKGGAHVLIASRKGAECEKIADELNALDAKGSAEGFAGDIGSEEGIMALANEIKKRCKTLHILVNNAGVSWGMDFDNFPHAAWEKVMNINVAALFTLTRELTPLLEKSSTDIEPTRVINLGSVMGTYPVADGAYSYSASKAAVHHLTKILAQELASKRITVNALAPGPFPSKMTAFATENKKAVDKINQNNPLGRLGNENDIAGAILFLCGRGGAYVTGAIIPLDGGISVMTHPDALFPEIE